MKHIAICIDQNFLLQSMVMLESLFLNSGNHYTIHVIIDNKNWIGYKRLFSFIKNRGVQHVIFYEVSESILSKYPPTNSHFTTATYHRLFLGSILPDSISTVLYLDCDLIVLKNIDKLFEIELNNYDLAAATSTDPASSIQIPWSVNMRPILSDLRAKLNLDQERVYFNAGVMLINLNRWRFCGYEQKFLNVIANEINTITYADQCVLNKVCQQILQMNWRYNAFTDFFNYQLHDNFNDVIIAHFVGKNKPWNNKKHPLLRNYFYYLRYNLDTSKFWALTRNALINCNSFFKKMAVIRLVKEILFILVYVPFPRLAVSMFYYFPYNYGLTPMYRRFLNKLSRVIFRS